MRLAAAFVALLLALPAGASTPDQAAQVAATLPEASPEEVVRSASDELLSLIESGRAYVDEDPERFYQEVDKLLSPIVDFDRFARNVMGPYWKSATQDQQVRFIDTFKWGLLRTYATALTEFSDGEVLVLEPDRPPRDPARRNVKMEIKTVGGIPTRLCTPCRQTRGIGACGTSLLGA